MIKSYNDIPGWFDFHDIYDLAISEAVDGDRLLEIGCFLGKSMAYLGERARANGKRVELYVIDLFEPQGEEHEELIAICGKSMAAQFQENMSDLGLEVQAIKADSTTGHPILPEWLTFLLIFIDADHTYEAVKKDLENWWPHVQSGGIFAGHDYGEETAGVKPAVDEFCLRHGVVMQRSGASWIIRKA